MKRNMFKIADGMSGKIPSAYSMSCAEGVQLREICYSGRYLDALHIAFKYGFALALRMEANRRKKAVANK